MLNLVDVGDAVNLEKLTGPPKPGTAPVGSRGLGLGEKSVVDLVHGLPVSLRIDERDLDLQDICHGGTRLFQGSLHDLQRISSLPADVARTLGAALRIPASDPAQEQQVSRADRALYPFLLGRPGVRRLHGTGSNQAQNAGVQ